MGKRISERKKPDKILVNERVVYIGHNKLCKCENKKDYSKEWRGRIGSKGRVVEVSSEQGLVGLCFAGEGRRVYADAVHLNRVRSEDR